MTSSTFPVVYSTLDSSALINVVLSQYEIGSPICCQFWIRGLSDIYLVTTPENRYVLRVSHSHWRSRSEIAFELALLQFLQKHQLPVAAPIYNRNGELSIQINAPEGDRFATLFTYAPGEVPLGDFNQSQGHHVGEAMAKMHLVCQSFHSSITRPDLNLVTLLDESLLKIHPFLQHRSQDWEYLTTLIRQVKDQIQVIPKEIPFWTICWGDPHSGNVHFTEDNQLTMFDFDQCGYGWRAFDIGKFLQITVRSGLSKKVREAFLEGYQGVAAITQTEHDALQAFTQAAHIWSWSISIQSALMHHHCQLDDSFFTLRLHQLKRLKSPDWQLF